QVRILPDPSDTHDDTRDAHATHRALPRVPRGVLGRGQEGTLADARGDARRHDRRHHRRRGGGALPGRGRFRAPVAHSAGAQLMAVAADRQWYVVHAYSGYEHKVKASLEERIRGLGNPDLFGEILVPSEKVVELVKGKKKTSSRKFFPGYILVNMKLN